MQTSLNQALLAIGNAKKGLAVNSDHTQTTPIFLEFDKINWQGTFCCDLKALLVTSTGSLCTDTILLR